MFSWALENLEIVNKWLFSMECYVLMYYVLRYVLGTLLSQFLHIFLLSCGCQTNSYLNWDCIPGRYGYFFNETKMPVMVNQAFFCAVRLNLTKLGEIPKPEFLSFDPEFSEIWPWVFSISILSFIRFTLSFCIKLLTLFYTLFVKSKKLNFWL